jgi:hypothetical protein
VPPGGVTNYVGLLTVDLPPTVRKGDAYTIVVRQVTTAAEAFRSDVRAARFTRRMLGSFQITVPVAVKEELLGPAEQLLAIMRWVAQGKQPGDRWTPVLDRFLEQLAERVEGFGGDPSKIPPSPIGFFPRRSRSQSVTPARCVGSSTTVSATSRPSFWRHYMGVR